MTPMRADAEQNRERILEVALVALKASGAERERARGTCCQWCWTA
ncbi:hypothetical protein ACFVYA_23300 [Amycolatopsis sp. NPDC058278]